jgi:hypothetical protein
MRAFEDALKVFQFRIAFIEIRQCAPGVWGLQPSRGGGLPAGSGVEEGGGRKGADIRKNDQYGFEAPNRFLVLFCDQKRIPRAMRTFHKKHPPQNSETAALVFLS